VSEEKTREQTDPRSFEERVFARFDAIDARLKALEDQAERQAMDTKPIWERALSAIMEIGARLERVERKLDVLGKDMLTLRADQVGIETRLDKLEAR